jgi:fatty acid amide hydrolase 2
VVHILPDPVIQYTSRADKEIQQAVMQAADIFKSRGSTIRVARKNLFEHSLLVWYAEVMDLFFGKHLTYVFGNGKDISLFRQFMLTARGKSEITFPALLACSADKFLRSAKPYIKGKYIRISQSLRKEVAEMLGDQGILLMPVYPTTAPKHNHMLRRPFDWSYTSWLNCLGFPATVVPIKMSQAGLPIAIQVISNSMNDHRSIDAARILEQYLKENKILPKGAILTSF